MIRNATARVVSREDFVLPPVAAAASTETVKPHSIEPPPAIEPQRYVVQLGWWSPPVDPTTLPQLPMFRAFDLYAVGTTREGTVYQGIRLGFFKNIDRARRAAAHVRSHYPRVGVVPVSYREYARVVELMRQRARPAPAPVTLQGVQPGNRNASAASSPGRLATRGPPWLPRREQRLSSSGTGDPKSGSAHHNERSEDLGDELRRVQQFLDLLAPRELKARTKS